jgi:hypothetical protein
MRKRSHELGSAHQCTVCMSMVPKMFQGKLLYTIAPLIPRNYVVMEVKSNLLKSERQDLYHLDIG